MSAELLAIRYLNLAMQQCLNFLVLLHGHGLLRIQFFTFAFGFGARRASSSVIASTFCGGCMLKIPVVFIKYLHQCFVIQVRSISGKHRRVFFFPLTDCAFHFSDHVALQAFKRVIKITLIVVKA
jgi:hypothetical protein